MLIGNKILLHRILLNLLSNAIKFTNEGSVSIHSELIEKVNMHHVTIEIIEDTGIGIPNNKPEEVFEY